PQPRRTRKASWPARRGPGAAVARPKTGDSLLPVLSRKRLFHTKLPLLTSPAAKPKREWPAAEVPSRLPVRPAPGPGLLCGLAASRAREAYANLKIKKASLRVFLA